jgi:REP element-mobilizing transposase RayT
MKKEAWKSTGTAVYNINYHFMGTARQVSSETIKRYIEAQKTGEGG